MYIFSFNKRHWLVERASILVSINQTTIQQKWKIDPTTAASSVYGFCL